MMNTDTANSEKGRKPHNLYKELGFESLHLDNGRMGAKCDTCNHILKNTAISRLRTHRKRCFRKSSSIDSKEGEAISSSDDSVRSENVMTPIDRPVRRVRPLNREINSTAASTGITSDDETQEVPQEVVMEVEVNTSAPPPQSSYRVLDIENLEIIPSPVSSPLPISSSEVDESLANQNQLLEHGYAKEERQGRNFPINFAASISTASSSSSSSRTDISRSSKLINGNKNNSRQKKEKKTKNLSSFVDKMNQKEKEEANISLAKFFFGCNIPFSVVESDHFKNFLKLLRPAYNPPTRKTLSSTLLDKVHEHVLINNKNSLKKSATLLIDGWKNSSNNTNNVVTMLQTLNGESVFLESYDFSTAKETGEALAEVCNNALETAKSAYNCEIYAVVSDNASNMVKMGRLINLWHSTCSSHTGNLLVKDIVDHDVMKTVTLVLKEFKHTTLENTILQRGGLKIVLPVETRWCSHRDSCDSLLKNLRIMKQVAAEDEEHTKIKAEVTCYLYNEEFIESVKATVALLDPICKIINTCQNKSTSIADSTEEWLKLNNQVKESESYNDKIKRCVKSRTNMALNTYSLAANYLHPNYRGNLLSKEQKQMVQDFLINSLDSEESLDGLNAFIRNEGIFDTLKKKAQNISVSTFWGLVETKYEALSTLAQKLLSIPASSAQLERLFSNWSFVHSDLRNRLTKEKSSKLVSVYYSLKLKDSNVSDQY